ncbi:MAG TPA: lamin tail domain-containing protein [Spirochaetales bacterium]|nr:lamin tail domain-containing protein [Spirochaetales bacterium]
MKKNFSAAFRAVLLTLGFLAAGLAGACRGPFAPPSVLSFGFRAADNAAAGLAEDVWASIDHELGVITVRLPDTVADYSSLKAAVSLPEGSSALPSVPTDYSLSPTALVVANEDSLQRVYLVDVGQRVAPAPADAVLFTEYYAGTGYGFDSPFNRWIEITNRSGNLVDLAQYRLVKSVWENGARVPARDQDVALRGQLAAGASLVLYADRTSTTFSQARSAVSPDLAMSDIGFNAIIDFDGDDGYQLTRNGVVLDALGPNGGAGAAYVWGAEKRMLRKNGTFPSATWDEMDWVAYAISNTASDDDNCALVTPTFTDTDTTLTYFALEDMDPRVYGIIDNVNHTVTLSVVENTDLSAVKPFFSTQGNFISLNGEIIYSGVSTVNLSLPVTLTVWAYNGSFQDYAVSVSYYHVLQFTTVNHDFVGNVDAAWDTLMALGDDDGNYTTSFPAGTEITGIVTAKDVYVSSGYNKSFFVQDADRGILVCTGTSIPYPMGAKVTFTATSGSKYYGMPEVTAFTGLSRVGGDIFDIYYREGNYDNADARGSVYRWEGVIAESMDNFSQGTFEGSLKFHSDRYAEYANLLTEGKRGEFFGPVSYSYSAYRMEISDEIQIKVR